jgi:hypothetical protein
MRRVARYVALAKLQAPATVIEKELNLIREVHPELTTADLIYCLLKFHAFQQEDEEIRERQIREEQEELDKMTPEDMLRLADED